MYTMAAISFLVSSNPVISSCWMASCSMRWLTMSHLQVFSMSLGRDDDFFPRMTDADSMFSTCFRASFEKKRPNKPETFWSARLLKRSEWSNGSEGLDLGMFSYSSRRVSLAADSLPSDIFIKELVGVYRI